MKGVGLKSLIVFALSMNLLPPAWIGYLLRTGLFASATPAA